MAEPRKVNDQDTQRLARDLGAAIQPLYQQRVRPLSKSISTSPKC